MQKIILNLKLNGPLTQCSPALLQVTQGRKRVVVPALATPYPTLNKIVCQVVFLSLLQGYPATWTPKSISSESSDKASPQKSSNRHSAGVSIPSGIEKSTLLSVSVTEKVLLTTHQKIGRWNKGAIGNYISLKYVFLKFSRLRVVCSTR